MTRNHSKPVDSRRIRVLAPGKVARGPVLYVMARDQRAEHNWALLYAQQQALEQKQPIIVACPVAADYPDAPSRQVEFILAGLQAVGERLAALRIPFVVANGPADRTLSRLVESASPGLLVCDFNPLRESRRWKGKLAQKITVPLHEVDAHNIIPAWEASEKLEYAAYTIRPKIHRQLKEFLTPIWAPVKHPFTADVKTCPDEWKPVGEIISTTSEHLVMTGFEPGDAAARKLMSTFLMEKLDQYDATRNDPNRAGQSDLSPYIHFGQLSAQHVALELQQHDRDIASQEAFLEELVVRRELSDNYCLYNEHYDSFKGFHAWAQKTLNEHRADPRPYLYDRDTLEAADTHDKLWNAAQSEMMITGKMHGYMRMYWAKKILEWTPSPEDALAYAIYLNNAYELDGHDPNGYTGIAWSIGGVHDRAWSERDVFGKIRYMSAGGCKRKFRVDEYIQRMATLNLEDSP